jgi:hypothetical protein
MSSGAATERAASAPTAERPAPTGAVTDRPSSSSASTATAAAAAAAAPPPPPADGIIVGLRIRPLLARDKEDGSTECLRKVHGEPQVVLGADRAFTFNHVFDPACSQEALYQQCKHTPALLVYS